MAQIAWNPIAIPNISSTAIEAQRSAGNSLQQAFAGMRSVLGEWEGARRDANLSQLYDRQNEFAGQDPAAYEEALRTGALTKGLSYLRPEDRTNARQFSQVLRQTRDSDAAFNQGQTRFKWEEGDRNRTEQERTAMRGAYEEMLPALQQARASGDPAAVDALLAQVASKYPQISTDGLMRLATAGSDSAEEGRSRQSHGLNMERGRFGLYTDKVNFSHSESDRAESRNAETLASTVRQLAGVNIDDKSPGGGAEAAFAQALRGGNYNAREIRIVADALGISVPMDVLAQMGATEGQDGRSFSGGSYGPVDMGEARQTVGSVLTNGGMPSHVVAGFLGNFEVEGGYKGARGDGGSANGIAQWRGARATNFERVIGKPISQASIAEQAEYVKWEMANPTHPSVGMTVRQRDAILNAPNAQVAAELIDKYYERSSGEHRDRRVSAAGQFAQQRWGESLSGNTTELAREANNFTAAGGRLSNEKVGSDSFLTSAESVLTNSQHALSGQGGSIGRLSAGSFNQTQSIKRSPTEVATAAVSAGGKDGAGAGVFANSGVERSRLQGAIQELVQSTGVTSDTALNILRESTINGRNLLGQMTGNVRALGGGTRVDMVRAAQIARTLGSEGGANLANAAESANAGLTQAQAMRETYAATLARYKASVSQDATRLGAGQISDATLNYGRQLMRLEGQLADLTNRAAASDRSFRAGGAVSSARAPVSQTPLARTLAPTGAFGGRTPVATSAAPQRSEAPNVRPIVDRPLTLQEQERARAARNAEIIRNRIINPNPLIGLYGVGRLLAEETRERRFGRNETKPSY